jgi:methionyl-tRNA formyltransferase
MTAIPNDQVPEKPGIIFMGTPEFAIPSLQRLIDEAHDIIAVVTQPDRPRGRGKKLAISPVKELALEHNIEVLQPEKAADSDFCRIIEEKAPDLILVVAFGQILTRRFIMIPRWGAVNIHASLLPKYRGAAPIQWAILNNEPVTGITVMRIEEGLDSGPILYQEEVPIQLDETAGHLHDRLAYRSVDVVSRFLRLMSEKELKPVAQDHSCATYAPKIGKDMALIKWDQDAVRISSLVRALDPRPGAWTTIGDKKIKVFASSVIDETCSDGIPGRVSIGKEGAFQVETGRGMVEIREIQYPGKRRLPSEDFLRGFSVVEGTILGRQSGSE